mmetsp:Transcript_108463/g.315440  ORF Transcript_108463/g.315440 Transcript_108463/m.315440 type:complete len:463 (+) Transcript_108463:69-1457(+)
MGNAPARPTEVQASMMHSDLDDACTRAARAMAEADVLVLCLGDRLQEASTTAAAAEAAGSCESSTALATSSLLESDPSLFYGIWGHQFNISRTSGPHPAFEILSRWCKKFAASPAAAKLRERQAEKALDERLPEPARATPAWKQVASRVGSSGSDHARDEEEEEVVELMYGSSDEENEAEKELTFDLRDPGAFHIFTSNTNGHAARVFGRNAVRECRGAVDQWQCCTPCRDGDVWTAPPGLLFNVDVKNNGDASQDDSPLSTPPTEEEGSRALRAPTGEPASCPTVHVVPMWHGGCMDRALSVADSFRTNHPRCRSCGGPSRPNLQLERGDVGWTDAADRHERYAGWKRALLQEVHAGADTKGEEAQESKSLRVVIVEIGAFARDGDVTTVRQESQALLRELNGTAESTGAENCQRVAQLIRINAHYPLIDGGAGGGECISVMGDELEALAQIDEALSAMAE